MKTSLNIFVLGVALVVAQACGSKSEQSNDTNAASETPALEITVDEKRALAEKKRAARAESRRIELEERIKTTPYYTDAQGNVVFNKAEVDPTYEGGEKAMMKYLNDNIVFPKEAEEKGLEGTVFVDFVIGANGIVREVVVKDAPGEDVDPSFKTEAIRVVSSMPKWTPGKQNGKPIDVSYSLPVTFQIL